MVLQLSSLPCVSAPFLPTAFELLSRLPQHGLGSKLSRTGWTDDCFWTVQKVRLSPVRPYSYCCAAICWP